MRHPFFFHIFLYGKCLVEMTPGISLRDMTATVLHIHVLLCGYYGLSFYTQYHIIHILYGMNCEHFFFFFFLYQYSHAA